MSWLPEDMRGLRLLDAGCGTGALWRKRPCCRGAEVLAIDLSPTLVNLARERHAQDLLTNPTLSAKGGSITFWPVTCLAPNTASSTMWCAWIRSSTTTPKPLPTQWKSLTQRTRQSVLFTFAPALALVGRRPCHGPLVPAHRPLTATLAPMSQIYLHVYIERAVRAHGWRPGHMQRVSSSGFYTSQAWEWKRT